MKYSDSIYEHFGFILVPCKIHEQEGKIRIICAMEYNHYNLAYIVQELDHVYQKYRVQKVGWYFLKVQYFQSTKTQFLQNSARTRLRNLNSKFGTPI